MKVSTLLRGRTSGLTLMGVWFAVILHLIWATTLIVGNGANRRTTGLYALSQLFPNHVGLAVILIAVAGCALLGILSRPSLGKVFLLVPQQLVLGVSAAGALHAMAASQFADGVVRSQTFLIADQSPVVLALLIHSATIMYLAATHSRR